MLTPVSLLYGAPDDAVAELRCLRARHLPVTDLELGEEPDGQYITPEDYGALFIQWADALHRVDPHVRLGGPSFQTAVEGWVHWSDARGDTSWLRRFLTYLAAHGHRSDFRFFSFEWYPFDDITQPVGEQVPHNAALLDANIQQLIDEGLPRDIPWIISEYGYSSYATEAEETLAGALVNAETVARFLSLGGATAYLYGYEPGYLNREKSISGATWGNVLTLLSYGDDDANVRLPTYWAARLLTQCWAGDPHAPHRLYGATVAHPDGSAEPMIGAYPLQRPDKSWAILLLNKDARHAHTVRIHFDDAAATPLRGPLTVWTYGTTQYIWKADGQNGHPERNSPPARTTLSTPSAEVTLPPFSLCVVQGSGSGMLKTPP